MTARCASGCSRLFRPSCRRRRRRLKYNRRDIETGAAVTTTLIKNAGWVIAWDAGEKRQVYRKGIDVAFGPGGITHVGPDFHGPADATIDGRTLMVMPGLV